MNQPLLFHPILLEKVWGGRALEKLGKKLPPDVPIGESWELADLPASIPNGRSIIENGLFVGRTLREAIEADQASIMGFASLSADGGFPLLIKFLDARENLSVQVHPDAAYIERYPEAHLKSEAWIVLDADPGTVIYKGVRPGVKREQFAEAIEMGTVPELLNAVPVNAGDCHYLPSGTLHALGAGIVVAEVQTPSDTTFRVFDWGREQSSSPREMHIEPALECMSFDPPPGVCVDHHPIEAAGLRTSRLVRTEHFEIVRIDQINGKVLEVLPGGMPEVWIILSGEATVSVPGDEAASVRLPRGRTALFPASMPETDARLSPGTSLLRVTLPSPIEGLIAEG